jgi:MoaA/NifB/PqqE/SkfB family radical SAM enzyme
MGKYQLSLSELKMAIESGNSNPDIHLELGRSYRCMEKWELAIGEYEKAIREAHGAIIIHRVHRELAWLYLEAKKYDLASKQLKRAIELRPEDGWLNVELARTYSYGKKEYDLAIKEFKKAREKGVDNDEMTTELAKLYRENEEYALSIGEFKKILEISVHKSSSVFKNKILSEIELSQRKIILDTKPRIITVTLTSMCNLNCIMCEVWKQWKEPWELPEQTAKEIMKYFPYMEYVTWSGGEVFLYRHFRELFEEALRYPNLRQEIVTNGLLIDKEWAEKLVQSNLVLIYSIDGFTKESYENIRKGAKFQDLVRSLNTINDYRGRFNSQMYLVLNFVVMKSNLHEIEKIIDFAIKYKFNEIRFTEVKFLQNEENIFYNRDKEAMRYILEVMPSVLERAKEHKIILRNWFLNFSQYFDYVDDSFNRKVKKAELKKEEKFFCYLPWREMYIDPGGGVKLQCFCNQILGNVHKESIDKIWNGKIMQNIRKEILEYENVNFCNSKCISGEIPRELLGSPWDRPFKIET